MSEMHESGARGSTSAVCSPSTAAASHPPIPPSLLRRLAEAADGAKGTVWFVASYAPIQGKHWISEEFLSETAAQASVQNAATHGVFGPYEAPAVYVSKGIVGWVIETAEHGPQTITEDRYDAFFWSEAALRKFALPYYANLVGPEYASRIRDAFRDPEVLMMAHDILTEDKMIRIMRSGRPRAV